MPLHYFFPPLFVLCWSFFFFSLHIYHFCLLLSLGVISVMALCDGECGLDFLDGFIFFPFYLFFKSASSCFIPSCSLLWTLWFIRCHVFDIYLSSGHIFLVWVHHLTLVFPTFFFLFLKSTLHRYLAGSFLLFYICEWGESFQLFMRGSFTGQTRAVFQARTNFFWLRAKFLYGSAKCVHIHFALVQRHHQLLDCS